MNAHLDGSPTEDTIDVKCNPNIRRLTVRTLQTQVLPQLASYLKYLLSSPSALNIQQIPISVLLWSREAMNLREVDQVLDGVKFRGLREVAIVAHTNWDMDIVRQDFTDQFPSMFDRGILAIRKG